MAGSRVPNHGEEDHSSLRLAEDLYLDFLAKELSGAKVDFELLCAERPSLSFILRSLRAGRGLPTADPDSRFELDAIIHPVAKEGVDPAQLLERLGRTQARSDRYVRGLELGLGGTGRVYSAWDKELSRTLAMKVLHPRAKASLGHSPTDQILRFLREAQVTSQLDHPCIVPVYDLGVDENGTPFFTMKLVRGRELKQFFSLAWSASEGWNTTRAVTVLLKVCEAMGYAHAKGVVHRDLKPANIMVGRFGEVYVMDWGVAHLELPNGEEGAGQHASASWVTLPLSATGTTLTVNGSVLGTPPYMPPEQAGGDQRLLGVWTDIYAIGALLYHLLAKQAPYVDAHASSNPRALIERVLAGPPTAISILAPEAPPELVSICERAMARQPLSRYQSMQDLAEDLRAYLEGRVVRAHKTGWIIRSKKFLQRNRNVVRAASLGLAVVALSLWLAQVRKKEALQAQENATLQEADNMRQPQLLLNEFESLWPISNEKRPQLEDWLVRVRSVMSRGEGYHNLLRELRNKAKPLKPDAAKRSEAYASLEARWATGTRTIRHLEKELQDVAQYGGLTAEGFSAAEAEAKLNVILLIMGTMAAQRNALERSEWQFDKLGDELRHERLDEIIRTLQVLGGEGKPPTRLALAENVLATCERYGNQEVSPSLWRKIQEEIANPTLSPKYAGLRVPSMEHLVPLGVDPCSKLHEFAHILTGEVPRRDDLGELILNEDSALVLVLLPAGVLSRGSQDWDVSGPNYDPYHQTNEAPIQKIPLNPFWIAKHELTAAQWQRLTGIDCFALTKTEGANPLSPAFGMSWLDAKQVLHCIGLVLPTEAQWEYAARAGTSTPWWTGAEPASLRGAANLAGAEYGIPTYFQRSFHDFRQAAADPWLRFAPIAATAPNPYGLHDVYGNVAEHCRDQGPLLYHWNNVLALTGERSPVDPAPCVSRGGHFLSEPREARSATRHIIDGEESTAFVGLRPSLDWPEEY